MPPARRLSSQIEIVRSRSSPPAQTAVLGRWWQCTGSRSSNWSSWWQPGPWL